MTIVTKNSITLSNVNDGTITHTAYAYSADGTDRFSTVYPNLNLLHNWDSDRDWKSYTFSSWDAKLADASLGSLGLKVGDTITYSVEIDNTSGIIGARIVLFGIDSNGKSTFSINSNIIAIGSSGKSFITTVIPENTVKLRYSKVSKVDNSTQTTLNARRQKLELGSTVTPWMPSSSEATTADYPSYIGQYSDFSSTASTDPAKYAPWAIFKGNDGSTQYTHIAYANIKFICKERSDFTLSDISLVRYGSDSRWVYKQLQAGTYTATTTLFGSDPASGTVKNVELVSDFSASNPVDKTYIGMYVDFNINNSTNPSDYSWTLVKGSTGKPGIDGKTPYFHTAWAYSADGIDRFSTVYPNLNLGDNTKNFLNTEAANNVLKGSIWLTPSTQKTQDGDFVYLTSKPTTDGYDWFRFYFLPDSSMPNVTKINVKPNTNYTFSAWLKGTGQHTIYAYQGWTANNTPWILNINLTSDWKLYTFTVLSKDVIPASNVQFFIRSNSGTEINLKKPKVEEGSIATPYMPSSSEVKTSDYPNYIGTYSDSNVEASLDYGKYQWAIFKGQNSNAYVAYSWSSDGTDRFTTTYPNLNLLDGTKDFSGDWTNSSSWVNDGTYKGLTIKKRIGQWNGIYKTFTAPSDGAYTFSAYVKSSGNTANIIRFGGVNSTSAQATLQKSLGNNFDWIRDTITLNLKANDSVWIKYEISGTGTDSILWNTGHKWELGSVITPWMPSDSESQDQWQDVIPMYIGVGEKDSQNPSDYRWQLNSKYAQASSDSGLSNKAGIDDLASVASTANDALVQAQNAVSNEDYTSWLEHDYQTTIDNLQEISAQNQDDIKNVDDRTTIVEGFYGEMKVKWNFIDESFSFSEEGMFISNAQSKMSIQITSDKIVFWDNDVDVAFITGEVLNIQKGVFLESATIGNHLITKFSDDSPVTIIRYVGGIT